MSDFLLEELKKDMTGFESRLSDLVGRKQKLANEIGQVDSELRETETVYEYAKSMLNRMKTAPATAARRAKKAETPRPLN